MHQLLNTPALNKGTAFTKKEREAFELTGLLPEKVETLDQQVKRAYLQYKSYGTPLEKNIFLHELHNTNQTIFYRLVKDHVVEMLPILYTPTVGEAVKTFSQEFRSPYGIYISYPNKNKIKEILKQRAFKNIDLIVVTDSERILGLGDQGVGGIHIPIAKLMLYSLFGGIDPKRTLPIVLDVGTNNPERLKDPMYLGWKHKRISGKEYDSFIKNFVTAVKKEFPDVLFHWEDFGRDNAARNLELFRNKISSFNDDIQGTAVITLAALFVALEKTKQSITKQRIVILGAGSAGTGIADQISFAMAHAGMKEEEIKKCFWLIDKDGLLTEKSKNLTPSQKRYLQKGSKNLSLAEVVAETKPTILIGCAGASSAFSEKIIRSLAKNIKQPIIFPLSNPTEKSEATPDDLLKWTNKKALIATGSPFPNISQCNNAFAFPGIGLGVLATKATYVSDMMLFEASKAIFQSAMKSTKGTMLLPTVDKASEIALKVAQAVAKQACKEKLTKLKENKIDSAIKSLLWKPEYFNYL